MKKHDLYSSKRNSWILISDVFLILLTSLIGITLAFVLDHKGALGGRFIILIISIICLLIIYVCLIAFIKRMSPLDFHHPYNFKVRERLRNMINITISFFKNISIFKSPAEDDSFEKKYHEKYEEVEESYLTEKQKKEIFELITNYDDDPASFDISRGLKSQNSDKITNWVGHGTDSFGLEVEKNADGTIRYRGGYWPGAGCVYGFYESDSWNLTKEIFVAWLTYILCNYSYTYEIFLPKMISQTIIGNEQFYDKGFSEIEKKELVQLLETSQVRIKNNTKLAPELIEKVNERIGYLIEIIKKGRTRKWWILLFVVFLGLEGMKCICEIEHDLLIQILNFGGVKLDMSLLS